jgi:hypothetical protein
VACTPWDPVSCVSSVAKTAAGDAFSSIAHDFAKTADEATNWLWSQLGTATAVHLGGQGFSLDFGIVVAITATVALGLFVLQVITSTLKRDPGGLGRALRGLVVAFIGGAVAIAVTNLLLGAVDALSSGVVQVATGQSLTGMGHQVLANGAISSSSTNPAAVMVISLAALVAVLMVWAALMVRKILIVVSAVFAPLAFAGSLADITVAWTRRWIEVVVALIVSKLVLVLIFVIGLGMLVDGVGQAGTGNTQRTTQTISALLVLALAGFAPWLALKLVHWSGDQFHHLHSLAATSAAGAQKAARTPQKVQSVAVATLGGGAGAAASAGGVAASGGGASAAANRPGGPPSGGGSSLPVGASNRAAAAGSGPGAPVGYASGGPLTTSPPSGIRGPSGPATSGPGPGGPEPDLRVPGDATASSRARAVRLPWSPPRPGTSDEQR